MIRMKENTNATDIFNFISHKKRLSRGIITVLYFTLPELNSLQVIQIFYRGDNA